MVLLITNRASRSMQCCSHTCSSQHLLENHRAIRLDSCDVQNIPRAWFETELQRSLCSCIVWNDIHNKLFYKCFIKVKIVSEGRVAIATNRVSLFGFSPNEKWKIASLCLYGKSEWFPVYSNYTLWVVMQKRWNDVSNQLIDIRCLLCEVNRNLFISPPMYFAPSCRDSQFAQNRSYLGWTPLQIHGALCSAPN